MTRGALASNKVHSYRQDGFVVVPGVFGADEVGTWRRECDRLLASDIMHPDNLRTYVLGSERPPDRLDPVIDVSRPMCELTADPRLMTLATQLLGEEPSLFKDKVIFKPPGMQGYKCHQDYAYWHWLPAPPEGLLTAMVALDGATSENGAVEFFANCHDRLLTPAGAVADVDEQTLAGSGEVVETQPGDVVLFHSLTPHRSGDNRSTSMRRQLYLSYNAACFGDLYSLYYEHLRRSALDGMLPVDRDRAYFR